MNGVQQIQNGVNSFEQKYILTKTSEKSRLNKIF